MMEWMVFHDLNVKTYHESLEKEASNTKAKNIRKTQVKSKEKGNKTTKGKGIKKDQSKGKSTK